MFDDKPIIRETQMEIRPYTEEDIPSLVKLIKIFQSEHGCFTPVGGVDSIVFSQQLNSIKELLRAWVCSDGNGIHAALAMIEFANPFSGSKALEELFWFAIPGDRGAHNLKLINTMERYAHAEKIHYITMSSMHGINSDRLHRYYLRRGYSLHQTQYILTLKGGNQ